MEGICKLVKIIHSGLDDENKKNFKFQKNYKHVMEPYFARMRKEISERTNNCPAEVLVKLFQDIDCIMYQQHSSNMSNDILIDLIKTFAKIRATHKIK